MTGLALIAALRSAAISLRRTVLHRSAVISLGKKGKTI
jgi:hypothetical protein